MRRKSIYEKYADGDKLTNPEVVKAVRDFKTAADALVVLGPHFRMAFQEANTMYLRFYDMAVARNILEDDFK